MLRHFSKFMTLRSLNSASGKLARCRNTSKTDELCHYSSMAWCGSTPILPHETNNNLAKHMLSASSLSSVSRHFSTTQRVSIFSQKNDVPEYDPEKGHLVYIGTLANMVKLVKGFSVSTSLIGLCIQPFVFSTFEGHSMVLKMALGGTMTFFIFLTPVLLHFITKRYVTKLYYNRDTGVFTATTLTFFVNEKDSTFTAADVTIPEIPSLFATVKAKGNPLFVDPSLFLRKEGYIKLMGYDKPIEWQIPPKDKSE